MGVPATVAPNLPSLLHQAANRLESATSAAEVLEARDMARVAYDAAKSAERFAKAKNAHDDILATTHRAQADALEIEAMAKRRLADEYDAAQERGEVHGPGNIPNENVSTLAEIGLTGKDVHDARQIRDAEEADPGVVRRTLDEALDAGKPPTRAALKRAVVPRRRPKNTYIKQLNDLRGAWARAGPDAREQFLREIPR